MIVREHYSIIDKHSFHIHVSTRYWAEYQNIEELKSLLQDPRFTDLPILPIGGGCNLLFRADFPGLLIQSAIKTMELIEENEREVLIRVGSGLNWDELVEHCVQQGWGGLENLSGIPGMTGASPIQNIGAYGVEAKDCIQSVEVFDKERFCMQRLAVDECELSYRNSRFKTTWKDRFIVCYISYRLSKEPVYHLEYGMLKEAVRALGDIQANTQQHVDNLNLIRQAVLAIRSSKLPDPEVLGNAGSFFKNPELDAAVYAALAERFPELPHWELPDEKVKVSAAWMIEHCGWKGKSLGRAGVYTKQALVLVNLNKAEGEDIHRLYTKITDDVHKAFGVKLEAEVVFV